MKTTSDLSLRTAGDPLSKLRGDMASVHVFKAWAQETCNRYILHISYVKRAEREQKAKSYRTVDFK